MTKKLTEIFDLATDIEDQLEIEMEEEQSPEVKQELANSTTILNALSSIEKVDTALTTVSGIETHDAEMDDIAEKAIDSYEKLLTLGMNVSDAHAAKVLEVATNMLKTAMEAKDAKVNRKLKTIELQLKKARLDFDATKGKRPSGADAGEPFDRNELIRIISGAKDANTK